MGTREWVMEPAGRIVPLAGSVAAPSTLLPPAPSRPWAGGEGPVEKSALDARPRTTCGPVTEGERLSLLDALRGFALAGVLLANLNSLTLYEFLSPEQRAALPRSGEARDPLGIVGADVEQLEVGALCDHQFLSARGGSAVAISWSTSRSVGIASAHASRPATRAPAAGRMLAKGQVVREEQPIQKSVRFPNGGSPES